jgi:hypothetical protein
MPGIFLSYRRSDTEPAAGRLHDELTQRLPGVAVFRDIDSIPVTVRFADYIRKGVSESDVLIVVIGPGWESAVDEHGARRIDSELDFVRIEIETAIQGKIPIVPVLVGGATMPRASSLPHSLRDMTEWQNHELPSRLWKESCDRLVNALQPLVTKNLPKPVKGYKLSVDPLSIGVALVVLAAMGWLYVANRTATPTKVEERVTLPGHIAPAASVPGVGGTVADRLALLALSGMWGLDGEQKSISIFQGREFIKATDKDRPEEGALLRVEGPDRFFVTLPQSKATRRYVTMLVLAQSDGHYSWKATTDQDSNGVKKEVNLARGSVSADLRSWHGIVDDPSSRTGHDFTAALEAQDSLLRWTYSENGREQTLLFRKR